MKPQFHPSADDITIESILHAEREHILGALRETGWVVAGPKGAAARAVRIIDKQAAPPTSEPLDLVLPVLAVAAPAVQEDESRRVRTRRWRWPSCATSSASTRASY